MQTPTFPDDQPKPAYSATAYRFVTSPRDYCGDDMVQIIGIPECDQAKRRAPLAWAMVFGWLIVLFTAVAAFIIGYLLGHAIGSIDLEAFLDFVTPTAAQAREVGWVALSEGL